MRWDIKVTAHFFASATFIAVVVMVAPDYLGLSDSLKAGCFWVGLIGAIVFGLAGLRAAILGEREAQRGGRSRRMVALAGMIVCGAGFLGFSAAYFWPTQHRQSPGESDSALAKLAESGWSVRAQSDAVEFSIMARTLPDMKESAQYLALIGRPYSLVFGQVTGLDGLHYAANVGDCTTINVNSGEFTDISELRGFTHLRRLIISQLPLTQPGIVDTDVLAYLTGLTDLSLGSTRIRDVEFARSLPLLKTLSIGQTLVGDISPLSTLHSLEFLDVRGSRVTDLTPLRDSRSLRELTIDGLQLPSLSALADLPHLNKIIIIEQGSLQLSPLSGLASLESLFIWGPGAWGNDGLDLAPLHGLVKLRNLNIRPATLNILLPVANIEAIGGLTELRTIVLGQIQISSIAFLVHLKNLEEASFLQIPLTSIEPLQYIKSLKNITLVDIPVADISPLLALPLLTDLTIQRTPARADVLTQLEQRGVKVTRR